MGDEREVQVGMTVAEIVCILNLNGWALGGSNEAFPLLSSASSLFFSGGVYAGNPGQQELKSTAVAYATIKIEANWKHSKDQGVTNLQLGLPWHTANQSIAHRQPQPASYNR